MKAALSFLATLLLSSMLWAQTGTAAQDKQPADANQPATVTAAQVQALQDALAAQQKQIDQQQQQMVEQQQQIEALRQQLTDSSSSTAHVTDASLHTSGDVAASPARAVVSDGPQDQPKPSPLSIRLGMVDFTFGGFLDLSNVWRSENTGNPTSTSFGSIPFSNTVAGHLTEYRLSAQHSRVFLRGHTVWNGNDITGYVEADFNGNDAANVFVGTNPHTNRLRHYYVDIKHNKFELLAGQTWGWLVPNKTGLGTDQWVTAVWDPNYNVGLPVTRNGQIRFIYHPTEHWGLGVAIENPQQFTNGEAVFPALFNAQLANQLDSGAVPGTPNLHPLFLGKIAYDAKPGGHAMHFEVTGAASTVKITQIPVGVPGATFRGESKTGGAIQGFTNIELIKKHLTFYAMGLYSDGLGRQLLGLGPDTVIRPIQTGPGAFFVEPSLVHTASGIAGFEATVTPRNLIYAYYGGSYFQRNTFPDVTAVAGALKVCAPGQPATNFPCIGFGGLNSANSNNRALQEPTVGWTFTMWKDPNYGSFQFLTQVSYVTRAPWFVSAGAPKNAHLAMVFVDLRYTLP